MNIGVFESNIEPRPNDMLTIGEADNIGSCFIRDILKKKLGDVKMIWL